MDDTLSLLQACSEGVAMGVRAIDDVLDHVETKALHDRLCEARHEHEELDADLRNMLRARGETANQPSAMLRGMSTVMTEVKMAVKPTDGEAASLITDGCNMGVKSLNQYLNQYAKADEKAREIARRLIRIEEHLVRDIRAYL